MPELPEVETTKTSLAPLIGQEVTAVDIYQPKLRWPMPDDLHTLIGYRLIATTRRAKYLILHFAPSIPLPPSSGDNKVNKNKSLLIHLGMSGSLQQYPAGQPIRKHDHLIVTFASGIDKTDSSNQSNDKNKDNNRAASSKLKNPSSTLLTQLHYHDPRRFGAVLWLEDYEEKLLNHLGVEPLSETFNGQYLFSLIQRHMLSDSISNATKSSSSPTSLLAQASKVSSGSKRPVNRAIKSVIMDQEFVVGVGNIYATESLYLSGIHPATPASTLSESQLATLVGHIKIILQKSIDLGGSSLRDFTVASGQTGYFQQTLHAYGRQGEPCGNCAEVLMTTKINGRASVFCPKCQSLLA